MILSIFPSRHERSTIHSLLIQPCKPPGESILHQHATHTHGKPQNQKPRGAQMTCLAHPRLMLTQVTSAEGYPNAQNERVKAPTGRLFRYRLTGMTGSALAHPRR